MQSKRGWQGLPRRGCQRGVRGSKRWKRWRGCKRGERQGTWEQKTREEARVGRVDRDTWGRFWGTFCCTCGGACGGKADTCAGTCGDKGAGSCSGTCGYTYDVTCDDVYAGTCGDRCYGTRGNTRGNFWGRFVYHTARQEASTEVWRWPRSAQRVLVAGQLLIYVPRGGTQPTVMWVNCLNQIQLSVATGFGR